MDGANALIKVPSPNAPSISKGSLKIHIIYKMFHLITKYSDGPFIGNALGALSNGHNAMFWH